MTDDAVDRGRPRRRAARDPARAVPRAVTATATDARRASGSWPRRPTTASTCSSSASASPAPGSRSTRQPAGCRCVAVDAHDLAFGTSRWSSKLVHGGLRYLAHGPGRRRPRERRRARHPDGRHRPAPHPRRCRCCCRCTPTVAPRQAGLTRGRLPRRRPAAAAARAPRATTLPRAAPALRAPRPWRSRPACAPTGCAAGCCPGTASSRTTPGWSSRIARTAAAHGARVAAPAPGSLERRPATAPRSATSSPATSPTIRARAVVNATGVWAGDLVPTCGCAPPAAPTSCCAPSTLPGLRAARHGAGARADQPVRVRAAPARRHGLRRPHRRARRRRRPRRARAHRGRDRLPARRASRRRSRGRCTATTWSGRTPGCGRCSTPSGGATADLSRRHAVLTSRHRRGDGRRRQAHDLPADGRGRRRRRRARGRPDGRPVPHPRPAAARRRRRAPALGRRRGARPAGPPLRHRGAGLVLATAREVTGLADDELLAPVAPRRAGDPGRAGLRA